MLVKHAPEERKIEEELHISVPVVVGVMVVVCFRSCLVGLAVAGGTFRIGNLSVSLKLFILSDGEHRENLIIICLQVKNSIVISKHALIEDIHLREQMLFIIS